MKTRIYATPAVKGLITSETYLRPTVPAAEGLKGRSEIYSPAPAVRFPFKFDS